MAGEAAMSARGKTLVPLLVVVAAVSVALQSLQVEPVDSEKPGELPCPVVGLGPVTGRWGK